MAGLFFLVYAFAVLSLLLHICAHDGVRSRMTRRRGTSTQRRKIDDDEPSTSSRSEVLQVLLRKVNELHADLRARKEAAGPQSASASGATAPAAAPFARQRRNSPAAAPAPAQQQSSRSGRSVKPAQKFGSMGELEGAASSFNFMPVRRRAMPPVSVETSVPAFAMPGGGEIYAYGLHAGVRKRFRAKVLCLRTQFPRIVVEYLSTEDGLGTSPMELPEMHTAYLTANDIEQINP